MSEESVGSFLKGLDENDALRSKFAAAVGEDSRSPTNVVAFAKKNGFDFTEKELEKASQAVDPDSGELDEDQLKSVAGGIIIVGGSYSTTLLKSISLYSRYNIQKVYE
jgi:predicted ribosomally synthesized peptide with nif11-like leader